MSTYLSNDVVKLKCSCASVRRFIKTYLSIQETDYWFRQTLTFKDNRTDEAEAKVYLIRLLDSLRKEFPQMPALFVQERQQRQGIHYHVIFLLFGPQPLPPEDTRAQLKKAIFSRWKSINGGKVHEQANWLTLRGKNLIGLDYLLKGIDPTGKQLTRATHWNGVRLNHILKANAKPVTKKEVSAAFSFVFNRRRVAVGKQTPTERVRYTKDSIQGMKAYLEWTGAAADWKTCKRDIVGKNVSDVDFLAYLNSGAIC